MTANDFDASIRRFAQDADLVLPPPELSSERRRRDDEILAWVLDQPRTESAGSERSDASTPTGAPARRRWTASLVAAAAFALIASVAIPLGWWSGPAAATGTPRMLGYSTSPTAMLDGGAPSASSVLLELAAQVDASPPLPRDAEIQFIHTANWLRHTTLDDDGTRETYIYPTARQSWLSPDGSLIYREHRGSALDARGRLTQTPEQGAPSEAEDVLPPGTIDVSTPADLPRDPESLRAELLKRLSGLDCTADPATHAWCLFTEISDLHTFAVVPRDLSSTMWQMLATTSGVSYLGSVADRVGREAEAIAFPPVPDDGYARVLVLLIDRGTGELVGTEQVDLDDPEHEITEPTVTGFTTYLQRAWVDHVPG